jgi:hypothetical protein
LDTAIHAAHEKTAHGSAPDERVLTNARSLELDKAAKKGGKEALLMRSFTMKLWSWS